ncbi:Lpg1974 family pore-forming outer membrane protein [Legionella spiritensis]|uniref:Major outer membrane protein n=1 Tax=Legionella spiritensis TaxID=452 RepID=A0A0W0YWD7_LEGSP|nr:Lpg1974 family pore-forming outer membrane protein [Legionella spiritensis]KTD61147.1 major outer membrane protein [Legionella spiritensis]SNV45207.1 major outer membrane protein [Legionella spiritensis]VEG90922.1 major outer membrane protein [Legionella spiritensis]
MNKKCLSMAIAGLCLVGTAFGGTAGVKALDKDGPICTSVLCAFKVNGGFYAGVTGYYVRPSETGIGQVTDSWLYAGQASFTARSKPFDPEHDWAGSVKVGYNFPESANNVEISYLFLDNTTHAVNDFSDGSIGFGSILFPDAVIPPTPGFVSDAYLKYEVNQVDLKVGRKYSDVSGNFFIRPSIGVRYAELKHQLTFAAPGNMISKFDGAGPMLSLDGNYTLGQGFGLVGYFDYALIVGKIDSHSFVNLAGVDFNFVWPKNDRIVNSLTGKLGIDYSHTFANDTNVVVEAGFQVNEYIDSMDTIRGTLAFGSIQRVGGKETNSFGFRGPYISLTAYA